LLAPLGLAEDFKTLKGKVYRDATISRVEADGIVLKTKTGISKVYFIELPKDVQERFRPAPAKTVLAQREREREPTKTTSWKTAVANPTAFKIAFVAGIIIIAAVVIVMMRAKYK
jgi:hypothetical protein